LYSYNRYVLPFNQQTEQKKHINQLYGLAPNRNLVSGTPKNKVYESQVYGEHSDHISRQSKFVKRMLREKESGLRSKHEYSFPKVKRAERLTRLASRVDIPKYHLLS
jgi:hypothetical protein